MTRIGWIALGLAVGLAGCAGDGSHKVPPPAHGGTLVELPDRKGHVEVVKRDAPGQAKASQVVLYFLNSSSTPMDPPPTAATLKLRGGKPIDFKSAEGGSMEAGPIPNLGDLEGELTATIDGKPITVPLGRR